MPLEERAIHARRTGAGDTALRLALDVLELAPGRVAALQVLYLALCLKNQGKMQRARALHDQAAAKAPGNPSITLLRAFVLARRRDAPAALALLDGMVREQPRVGAGELLEKGRLLDQMGRYEHSPYADSSMRRRSAAILATAQSTGIPIVQTASALFKLAHAFPCHGQPTWTHFRPCPIWTLSACSTSRTP